MFAVEVQIKAITKSAPAVWDTRAFCSTPEQAWEVADMTATKHGKPVRVLNERKALMERPGQELTGAIHEVPLEKITVSVVAAL